MYVYKLEWMMDDWNEFISKSWQQTTILNLFLHVFGIERDNEKSFDDEIWVKDECWVLPQTYKTQHWDEMRWRKRFRRNFNIKNQSFIEIWNTKIHVFWSIKVVECSNKFQSKNTSAFPDEISLWETLKLQKVCYSLHENFRELWNSFSGFHATFEIWDEIDVNWKQHFKL